MCSYVTYLNPSVCTRTNQFSSVPIRTHQDPSEPIITHHYQQELSFACLILKINLKSTFCKNQTCTPNSALFSMYCTFCHFLVPGDDQVHCCNPLKSHSRSCIGIPKNPKCTALFGSIVPHPHPSLRNITSYYGNIPSYVPLSFFFWRQQINCFVESRTFCQ